MRDLSDQPFVVDVLHIDFDRSLFATDVVFPKQEHVETGPLCRFDHRALTHAKSLWEIVCEHVRINVARRLRATSRSDKLIEHLRRFAPLLDIGRDVPTIKFLHRVARLGAFRGIEVWYATGKQ